MKSTAHIGGKTLAALALGSAIALAAAAQAQPGRTDSGPAVAKAAAPAPAKKAEDQPEVQAFHLKRADPEEVRQAVTHLWATLAGAPAQPGTPPRPGTKPATELPRMAVNARTKTVFIRGTPQAVELAAEVIEVIDGEPGKVSPKLKNLSVFQLSKCSVDEVMQVLTALELAAQVYPMKKSNTLLAAQGPHTKGIGEIIDKLESAPVKPAPKGGPAGGNRSSGD
jgi:hypothetical protein